MEPADILVANRLKLWNGSLLKTSGSGFVQLYFQMQVFT